MTLPAASSRDDGMKLNGLWIASVARCAPPGNKPTPEELRNCAPWLDIEMKLLTELRVGRLPKRSGLVFAHGAEYELPGGLIAISSYHPSLQNTNTGKLTRPMLLNVFKRARKLANL